VFITLSVPNERIMTSVRVLIRQQVSSASLLGNQ